MSQSVPLPRGWTISYDSYNQFVFTHTASGHTQHTFPTLETLNTPTCFKSRTVISPILDQHNVTFQLDQNPTELTGAISNQEEIPRAAREKSGTSNVRETKLTSKDSADNQTLTLGVIEEAISAGRTRAKMWNRNFGIHNEILQKNRRTLRQKNRSNTASPPKSSSLTCHSSNKE